MIIERTLLTKIKTKLSTGKAILILGPRQSGKSTILKEIAKTSPLKSLWLDCDAPRTRSELEKIETVSQMGDLFGSAEMILIDEAQRVKDIGILLKIATDNFPNIQLMVSGSSAFELSNSINEPLTGRKWEYMLLPFSTQELAEHHGAWEERNNLHRRLIFGMYPEIVMNPEDEIELLNSLSTSYLYKDVFSFIDLRKPEILEMLLKALALQLGSEVSYHGLSDIIGVDHTTIQRYLDLLEKTFVIFRLSGFSRNLRTELKRSRKIFFYDNGIRNALIGAFQPLELRQDVGALWENFLVSERRKRNLHNGYFRNSYFWRTTEQQELDYLEEYNGQLYAYEFKWNPKKTGRLPKPFANTYPDARFQNINPDNYFDFLMPE
ncbi:ATP-binding protein [Haliscomenobacter sp.]|uniref:ATP-binding protein n=1 Tax=Haliscomenobacter sp. TaxID=2717303 RepID=UPI003364FCB3